MASGDIKTPLAGSLSRILSDLTPEEIQRNDEKNARAAADAAKREEVQRAVTRDQRTRNLFDDFGKVYIDARIDSFVFHGTNQEQAAQREVVRNLNAYQSNIREHVTRGRGVVLFGAVGTGKDHFMASLLRAAIDADLSIAWKNGMDLYGDVRDRMDTNASEASLIRELAKPDILAISDPVPPWGPLSQHQGATLFRIIDRRYRDGKAMMVTINAADSKESEVKVGAAIVDRLKERSMPVFCYWPSYRELM